MRCLKRRLANHIWRMMISDEQCAIKDQHGLETAA